MKLAFQLLLSAFLLTTTAISAQDTEKRDLGSFDKISISTDVTAILVPGNDNKVEITAKNIDLDKIITDVDGGGLTIKIEQKWWANFGKKARNRKVEIVVTYTEDLHQIKASAGASVETDGTIVTNRISMSSSSGANMMLEVESQDAKASVSSGAILKTYGETNFVEVSVSSGANYDGDGLIAQDVEVKASSGANASVTAETSLKAKASSGANISYKGSPTKKDFSKNSGGSVSES